MEVHAHTHTARKKWTHYFWEFLMLFLAVFCGFTAENIREHKVEKSRGKEYIRSLYEDLKTDTANSSLLIKYDEEKLAGLEGMAPCYKIVLTNWKETACMGMLVKWSKSSRELKLTDRTLKQLNNAGGYRLLNKEDADSIVSYESVCKTYQGFESTLFQGAQDNVRNTLSQLADFNVLFPLQGTTTAFQITDTTTTILQGPLLFSDDKALLNKWFNELSIYRRVTNGQLLYMHMIRAKATNLIKFYKEKYHLD